MSEYLARAVIASRLAAADDQRRGHELAQHTSTRRRRRRRLAVRRWWDAWAVRPTTPAARALATAPAVRTVPPAVEVARILEAAAHRIDLHGTASERHLLAAISEVVAQTAPGAAAALVDDAGTESSRLRAFGLMHAHVLHALGPGEQAWLLDLVEGRADTHVTRRVA